VRDQKVMGGLNASMETIPPAQSGENS